MAKILTDYKSTSDKIVGGNIFTTLKHIHIGAAGKINKNRY